MNTDLEDSGEGGRHPDILDAVRLSAVASRHSPTAPLAPIPDPHTASYTSSSLSSTKAIIKNLAPLLPVFICS